MKLKRKILLLTLTGILVVSLLAGTTTGVSAEKTEVTIWGWDIMAKSVGVQEKYLQIHHPNIKINDVTMGFNDVRTKVTTALLAGVGAPDIFFSSGPMTGSYIKLGGMLDLTEEIAPIKEYLAKPWLDNNTGPKGRIWGFPWDAGPSAVFYRKDVFDEAGIAEFPQTWDEFIRIGKKLTVDKNGDGEIDRYMLAMASGGGNFLAWYQMFTQSKGLHMTNAAGDLLFDDPEIVDTFEWIVDLALEHEIAEVVPEYGSGAPDYWAAFKQGRYVTEVRANWVAGFGLKRLGYNPEHEWRVAHWPSWKKGKKTGAIWGGSGMMIPKQTKHPEEALAVAKFICTTRGSQMYNFVNYDKFPTFTPAWDLVYNRPDPFFGGQKVYKIWIDQLKVTPGMAYGPNWSEINSAFQQVMPDMLSGEISVSEGTVKAKKIAKDLIK